LCDLAREAADAVVEWLQDEGVHHRGAITLDPVATVVSDAAARAESTSPGHGSDALVWEALEATTREEATLTPSLLVLMAVASMIAGVGILLDSPILVVGAMVVGPEYGPLAALCVAAVRRRWSSLPAPVTTLAVAIALGVAATAALTIVLRVTGIAPEGYALSERELTAFISRPDGLAAVVAVLAGVAGMLSLTEARTGTLVGVLVSVTTIPAIANIRGGSGLRAGPRGAWCRHAAGGQPRRAPRRRSGDPGGPVPPHRPSAGPRRRSGAGRGGRLGTRSGA